MLGQATGQGGDPRAVQRSLHELIFGEMIEAAEGAAVAGVAHVCDLVGAQDVGGEVAAGLAGEPHSTLRISTNWQYQPTCYTNLRGLRLTGGIPKWAKL